MCGSAPLTHQGKPASPVMPGCQAWFKPGRNPCIRLMQTLCQASCLTDKDFFISYTYQSRLTYKNEIPCRSSYLEGLPITKSLRRNFGVNGKTQAIGVGYQYDLSKRTALYSSLTHFKNDGAGYAPRIAGSMPAGLTNGGEGNVNEFVTGVRHTF